MSAAKAEPETIASAVANNTIFFMSIPIAFQEPARFRTPPKGCDIRLKTIFIDPATIWIVVPKG
jgi:hypothetical protein